MLVALLAATLSTLSTPPVDVQAAQGPPVPQLPPLPQSPPATLRARLGDPALIRAAVRHAVAGDAALPGTRRDSALGADPYRGFADAVDEARVPSCLHPDALKHQPPKIGPVALGGFLVLPFLAAAILRGKCN